MTIDSRRKAFMAAFDEMRDATMFGSRFFSTRPGNRFDTDDVNIDITRSGAEVAIVVEPSSATMTVGPRLQTAARYVNKRFRPAAYNPGMQFALKDVAARPAGVNPFDEPQYRRDLLARMTRTWSLIANKLIRARERQAWQVMQTGTLDLIDETGASTFTLNFGPKVTHFPTVATPWSNTAADIRGDLISLAKVVRNDSGRDANILIMGEDAFENFLQNDTIKEQADIRRYNDLVNIDPRFMDSGATMQGDVRIGNYRFDIWTYNGYFEAEDTGTPTDYLEADKVVMISDRTRFDALSASVNDVIVPDPRLAQFLPGRLPGEIDATPHAWVTPDGKSITVELPSRFLMVPTQIDGYACLDTDP